MIVSFRNRPTRRQQSSRARRITHETPTVPRRPAKRLNSTSSARDDFSLKKDRSPHLRLDGIQRKRAWLYTVRSEAGGVCLISKSKTALRYSCVIWATVIRSCSSMDGRSAIGCLNTSFTPCWTPDSDVSGLTTAAMASRTNPTASTGMIGLQTISKLYSTSYPSRTSRLRGSRWVGELPLAI